MPELPEVESVVRGLKHLEGQTIRELRIYDDKVWFESEFSPLEINGSKVESVTRHGKYIVFTLRGGEATYFLFQHLRMTGKMLAYESEVISAELRNAIGKNKQIRFGMRFDHYNMVFWDTRRFGTITGAKSRERYLAKKRLAPDPLTQGAIAEVHFWKALEKTDRSIKACLLDQSVAAGVGNIYADEALHRVGIHPLKSARRVKSSSGLFTQVLALFAEAITLGGSTVNNYLNVSGEAGKFGEKLLVYAREGEPCRTCGKGTILRRQMTGRSTHFCPRCQKR